MRRTLLTLALVLTSATASFAEVAEPVAEAGLQSHLDLEYANVDGKSLKLDLYLPEGEITEPLPVIMWVHGGGWRGGNKNLPERRVTPITDRGYALASVQYRLSDEATYPAQIHDCKAAVRWLRANAEEYQLDPNRIGAWGASAGGHLVALLGTTGDQDELEGDHGNQEHSSRVQAVCDWFGPTDFPNYAEHQGTNSRADVDAKSLIALLLGGPIVEKPELAKQASPVHFVSADDAPTLILHGDKDKLVPLEQSEVLRDALIEASVPVELMTLEGQGHGGAEFLSEDTMNRIWTFFDQHLQTAK